ncbi:MAG: type IV pilus assembly protein PilM [Candidatus Schekmanbacteria bacterium]|nr:type IV pilus assembly protein PilM [Candidatus Schekmanbacteria bacterium]
MDTNLDTELEKELEADFLEEDTDFLEEDGLGPESISPEEEDKEQLPPRTIYRATIGHYSWKKCLWGLDIGTQNVKVIGLRKSWSKWHLAYISLVEIYPGRKASKQDVNEQARIAAVLNSMEELNLEGAKLNTCLDRASVLIRQIQYPAAARDKILTALQWEVRKYIPFKPDEVVVDAQIIGQNGAEDTNDKKGQLDVLLVAATKEHLQQLNELLERVGVKPACIDAGPLALMNMLLAQKPPNPDETFLILDLGAAATTLNVLSAKGQYFTLSLSVGGNRFTNEIQTHCQLEYAIAEDLKRGKKLEDYLLSGNKLESAFHVAMEKNFELLVKEIRQALIYFHKQTGINQFSQLYLTGGGAYLTGLDAYLAQKTGIKVEIFNPFDGIQIDPKHFDVELVRKLGPQMALALGLASRE